MRAAGIIRTVDELGRIVLPVAFRRALEIEERENVEIYLDGGRIVLQKYRPVCVFCGSSHGLITYCDKHVCTECVHVLGRV